MSQAKSNKGVLTNLFWKFSERISAQAVTLLVSIILARILDPSHYGVIAIVNIFITIANVFVTDGFGNALIQKKDADELDFSSVLFFNIGFSIVLYLLLFFGAPLLASFYGEGYEILTPVLRVLGLRIIVSGINSVQSAYVSRHMIFKKYFVSTLSGTVASAVVGIAMAYAGFGVWALVAQYLTNTIVNTVVLMFVLKMKIILAFSLERLRSMVNYGYKILLTSLIITGYQELRAFIIGKIYSSEDLAYYDKGNQFPKLVVNNINISIGAVLFPKMSSEQDDVAKLKATTRNSVSLSAYIMSPIMLGLAAVAENFVIVVLTEKWLPCVFLMQLFCVFYLFQPIQTANIQALKALGRSDLCLKLEIIRDIIQLVVLVAVMWISVNAIVASMAALSILFVFINAIPNIKLLNYSLKEQIGDFLPSVILAGIMMVAVHFIGFININKLALLGLQVIVGGGVYLLLSVVTKNKSYLKIMQLVKSKLKK